MFIIIDTYKVKSVIHFKKYVITWYHDAKNESSVLF